MEGFNRKVLSCVLVWRLICSVRNMQHTSATTHNILRTQSRTKRYTLADGIPTTPCQQENQDMVHARTYSAGVDALHMRYSG